MTSPVTDALFVCGMGGFLCSFLGCSLFAFEGAFKPGDRKLVRNVSFALIAVGVVLLGILVVWHLKNLFGAW